MKNKLWTQKNVSIVTIFLFCVVFLLGLLKYFELQTMNMIIMFMVGSVMFIRFKFLAKNTKERKIFLLSGVLFYIAGLIALFG